MKNFKFVFLLSLSLLYSSISLFAGPTEDLWAAVKANKTQDALAAINAGADVNNGDSTTGIPLSVAACFADEELIKALIDKKSIIDFKQSGGNTPLLNAATWSNYKAMKLLIAAGADVHHATKYWNILSASFFGGSLEAIQMVVNAGVDPSKSTKVKQPDVTVGKKTFKGKVYEHFPFYDFCVWARSPKAMVALRNSQVVAVSALGLTIPARLLEESAYSSLESMTKYLIDKGCKPDIEENGTAAIFYTVNNPAINMGKDGILKEMIAAHADLSVKNMHGKTVLFIASEYGYADMVKMLVDAKADREARATIFVGGAYYNVTPLMVAALKGNTAVVLALCAGGAEVNASSELAPDGKPHSGDETYNYKVRSVNTALSMAYDNMHTETVGILLTYKAKGPKGFKMK